MRGLRVSLRLARRDAVRNRGRSSLVLTMIGLPVLVVTALLTLLQTARVTPREALPWNLGTADARIHPAMDNSRDPVRQGFTLPHGRNIDRNEGRGTVSEPWTTAEIRSLLGPDSRVIPHTRRSTVYRTEFGYARVGLIEVDLRDPLTTGMYAITSGRAPRSASEIVVSHVIAERIGGIGQTLRVSKQDKPMRVVGIVRDPRALDTALIVSLPGAIPESDAGNRQPGAVEQSWLVETPGPVSWSDVRELNAEGLFVRSRAVIKNPPPESALPPGVHGELEFTNLRQQAVLALIVGMVVLLVVLLAAPAFAVGVRRQRRQLALIAASGGSGGHIRSHVLASGIVLGAAGAAAGIALGLVGSVLTMPLVAELSGSMPGPWEFPLGQVLAVAVIGLGSGVLAALAPAAQAARQDVVAGLAGRRGQVRTRVGWPIAGLIAFGAGITITLVAYQQSFGIVAGTIVAQIGLVMASPWIVGAAGALARRLPLPLRLGVRDATRNRGRTAPAVAAIMASTAAITALAIGQASDFAQRKQDYTPRAPMGTAMVSVPEGQAEFVAGAITAELGNVDLVKRYGSTFHGPMWIPRPDCPARRRLCQPRPRPGHPRAGSIAIGGPELLHYLLGRDAPRARQALAAGKAIVFDEWALRSGGVPIQLVEPPDEPYRSPSSRDLQTRIVRVPAVLADPERPQRAGVLISPETARQVFGAGVELRQYIIDPATYRVSPEEQQRINERLAMNARGTGLYVERGFRGELTGVQLLLAAAALVLVLGASLVSTGLAAADSRPDLATLAAVGAAPRTRRLLAAGQAGFVAALGVLLGVLSGFIPGIAVTWPLTSRGWARSGAVADPGPVIDVPWLLLGGVAVVIPLLAALAAGLGTRSRLPMVQRIGQ